MVLLLRCIVTVNRLANGSCNHNTVWPEILSEKIFGGLLKIWYLAEFSLAVGQTLCHNDLHNQNGAFILHRNRGKVCQNSSVRM